MHSTVHRSMLVFILDSSLLNRSQFQNQRFLQYQFSTENLLSGWTHPLDGRSCARVKLHHRDSKSTGKIFHRASIEELFFFAFS